VSFGEGFLIEAVPSSVRFFFALLSGFALYSCPDVSAGDCDDPSSARLGSLEEVMRFGPLSPDIKPT